MRVYFQKNGGIIMPHSFTHILIHYIFSTKNREKFLAEDVRPRIFSYIGGIAKQNDIQPQIIGGIEDHVHMLLLIPKTLSIAKAIQLVKGGSSKWIHEAFPELKHFSWQIGYGAFSVSLSNRQTVINYIKNQKEHHRHRTFKEEFIEFLDKHHIEYDERYIWD